MGKIVIFGDSITYGKWDNSGGWAARLRSYIDEKCNIGMGGNVQVYNLGIPGDVTLKMLDRVKKELLPRIDVNDNTVVLLAIGINDSNPNNWMTGKQTEEKEFKTAILEMLEITKKANAKVALIGLTPVNEKNLKDGSGFTNDLVERYDNYLLEVAKDQSIPFLKLRSLLDNEEFRNTLMDGVHPDFIGHKMMFDNILEFLKSEGLIKYCTTSK